MGVLLLLGGTEVRCTVRCSEDGQVPALSAWDSRKQVRTLPACEAHEAG